jgi:hypothetical protein
MENSTSLLLKYLGQWLEYHRPMMHMYSKLTKWNNIGLEPRESEEYWCSNDPTPPSEFLARKSRCFARSHQ